MQNALALYRRTSTATIVSCIALGIASAVTTSLAVAAVLGKPELTTTAPTPIGVTAEPIAAFLKPGATGAGTNQLKWRGGLVLTSPSEYFGGYSGLILSEDGRDLMAVSDAGTWLNASLDYDDAGRLAGISNARIGAIAARDGKAIRRRRERDAEAVALASGTLQSGEALVSYENFNRIVRYKLSRGGLGLPNEVIGPPPGLQRFSKDGMEAMTVMRGGPYKGRMVAFSENAGSKHRHAGWIWIDGAAKPLHVVNRDGYALTSAASLQDGTMLLLERRFTLLDGVRMRLRRIEPAALKPGAILDGEVLIEADLSHEIDNMEGLAVHTDANGDTVLTMISDDNFNTLVQRTLLLQFTLPPRGPS